MASIHEFQKQARAIKPSQVKSSLFNYIRNLEELFIDLNIEQIKNQEDSKGKTLKHENPLFTGVYSEATEKIAKAENPLAPKRAGESYNFLWTGEFLNNFELFVKGEDLELFSTGTGNAKKKAFFDGYKNLFGLSDENLKAIIDNELLPFLQQHYKKRLGI